MGKEMRISVSGAMAIIAHEAIVLQTYLDSGGVPTIGIGHTAGAGGLIPAKGLKISVRDALKLFVRDLRKFERRVNKAIKVPMKQHEFDGFVSFDFNTGKIDGGSVDDRWNSGDPAGAIAVLKSYRNDNGKVVPGLEERRAEEAALIMDGVYVKPPKVQIKVKHPGKAVLWSSVVVANMLTEVMREEVEQRPAEPLPEPVPADVVTPPSANLKVNGGAVVTGGVGGVVVGGAVAVQNGFDWRLVAMVAGCAVAAAVIVWLVVKLRRES